MKTGRNFWIGVALGTLTWCSTPFVTLAEPQVMPTPDGFTPCEPGDPVASAEARLATQIGARMLSCSRHTRVAAPPEVPAAEHSSDYALALALPGETYKMADLDALLANVQAQWRGFDPMGAELKDAYVAQLNALLKDARSPRAPVIVSVKPMLFAINRPSEAFYTVTTIRTYVVQTAGTPVTTLKVNADAVVLRGSQLIRLTVQRALGDPDDVAQVQALITDWANAITRS